MKRILIALIGAAAFAPLPLAAKEKPPVFVVAKHVKDAPTVTLDPTKAYVLIRTPGPMPVSFAKIPTAEDQAAYEKLKAAAFDDAREDYAKKLARFESAKAMAAKTPGMRVPDKPVEPTEANFQFAAFHRLANFSVGLLNRFHSKDGSSYLHAVTPGTYRFLGQFDPLLGGGLCYCMGSVKFDAAAGVITDLGTLNIDTSNAAPAEKGDSSSPRVFAFAFTLIPADAGTAVDPRLTSLPRAIAKYRAAGKMANDWGIAISRLPAIPGVLTYERDRIIDPQAQ